MERLKKFKEKESFTFVNELVKAFPPPLTMFCCVSLHAAEGGLTGKTDHRKRE